MKTSVHEPHPQPHIVMRRSLEHLPALQLPTGTALVSFDKAGGGAAWQRICSAAFGRGMCFEDAIRSRPAFRPERIVFIAVQGEPAAVAAAWEMEGFAGAGYLHYVGVLPAAQGRGLGYWVSLAALYRMQHEGKTHAVLETQDERIPAIKTYFKLGFAPELQGHESYAPRWKEILKKMNG